ncbi:phosphoribosyltransferase domain-containing protein, partial [Actinocorallia longicatena]|uniref:phosphoribosyltransferase domain-containing protein n=1 Tax=Actinocorallia longicatena TaxID=111803 RepID=UPI0031D578A2
MAWPGEWVTGRLDLVLTTTAEPVGVGLPALVGLAVRRNPRRAHLLVSTVLGKHVPTDPRLVHGAGLLLGSLVAVVLGGSAGPPPEAGGLLRAALGGEPGAARRLRDALA